MQIIKKGKCPSLTGKSTLTYDIGRDEAGAIHLRITSNTGGGFYSGEWLALRDIETALAKAPDSITSIALFKLFKGKSVNSPAFHLAVLRHEGIVRAVKGRQRKHELADVEGFRERIAQMVTPGTKTKATTKKAPARKKAAARRR